MKHDKYAAGLDGEQQALAYLTSLGMTPVGTRFRAEDGEIDLILRDGDTLVFAEVKNRPSGRSGDGLLAVTPAKQRRILHAAQAFLNRWDGSPPPVRFDVVEITRDGLRHIPNAFWADTCAPWEG